MAQQRLKKVKKTRIERQTMRNRKRLVAMRDEFFEKNKERRHMLAQ